MSQLVNGGCWVQLQTIAEVLTLGEARNRFSVQNCFRFALNHVKIARFQRPGGSPPYQCERCQARVYNIENPAGS